MDISNSFGILGKATPVKGENADTNERMEEVVTYSPKVIEDNENTTITFASMQNVDGKIMGTIVLKYKQNNEPKEIVMATIKEQKTMSRTILEIMDTMKKQLVQNIRNDATYKKIVTNYDLISAEALKSFGDDFQFTPEGMRVFANIGQDEISVSKMSSIIKAGTIQLYKGMASDTERRSKVKAVVVSARQEAEREYKELLQKRSELKKTQVEARDRKQAMLEKERQEYLKERREDLKTNRLAKELPGIFATMKREEIKEFLSGQKVAKYLEKNIELRNTDKYEENSNRLADFLVENYDVEDYEFRNLTQEEIDKPNENRNDLEKYANIKEKGLVTTAQQYLKFAQLEGNLPAGITSNNLETYNRILQLIKTDRFGNIKIMLSNMDFDANGLIETLKNVEPDDTELIEYVTRRTKLLPTKNGPEKVSKEDLKDFDSFLVHTTRRDNEYSDMENDTLRDIAGKAQRILKNVAYNNRSNLITYNEKAGKCSAYILDKKMKIGFTDMEKVPESFKDKFNVTDEEMVQSVENAESEAKRIIAEEERTSR